MKEELKLFKALGDSTRLKILEFLLEREKCVCEIFPHVKRTQSTVSIQLGKLEDLGIVESRREGKKIFYKIKNSKIYDIFKALGNPKSMLLKRSCCMDSKGGK